MRCSASVLTLWSDVVYSVLSLAVCVAVCVAVGIAVGVAV